MKWAGWKVLLLTGLLGGTESCQQLQVEGVRINGTLTDQQDFTTNWRMCRLISRALHHDSQALAELVAFNCGGAGGCYDLADVATQILVSVGEPEFMRLTADFTPQQQRQVRQFIEVGLATGQYAVRKRLDLTSIDAQFPNLNRQLAD